MQLINARRRIRASFKRSLVALKAPARILRLMRPGLARASVKLPSPTPAPHRVASRPSDAERQRILDDVLSALRQLTSGAA